MTSLFTTQAPVQTNITDGVAYELGMRFTSNTSGVIQAIRYYKASNETGTHVGHIWSATGQELATVTFTNEGTSGWQQQALATPLTIAAGTTYVVSVNINSYYVSTTQGFASGISNGGLNAPVGAGVYKLGAGGFPTAVYQNANYFRDVVFSSNPNNHPGTVSVSGTPTQNQILTATVSDADGVPAAVTYQWQQSANGSTWSNISGATARTLTLGQAQVGSFIRATASYTDLQGSSEATVSTATTTAVANVNDAGAVAINGTPTQNQVLTASVTDVDGVPASIAYQWQSSPDGTTWTNLAATTASLTLDSSLVGKRVRVNAAYTDLLGASENVTSAATAAVAAASSTTTLFTTQAPVQTNITDGVAYELGMRFTSNTSGVIQAIRYYKSSNETGTHVGHIWSATGQELATVTFTNEGTSGWQQQALATPLTIAAGTTYVVSVNINSYYVSTTQGFASGISNGGLNAPVGAGVYKLGAGGFPTAVYQNANYFRDVVFAPTNVIALLNTSTIYVSEAAGAATVTVGRSGDLQSQTTVEYTTNEIGGAGSAQAGLDYIQPTFNGRANTGLVVFGPGESTKSFTIPIVNDQLVEGTETFAVGLQNPGSGSLGVPRTVLVSIVDDDSPASILMADAAVSVAESTPTATITLLRSGSASQAATVGFTTSSGSALAGSDFTTSSGTVTFAAGQVSQTISVPIINDTTPESDETFTVTLSNPTGATLGAQTTTTVKILDNDNPALGNLVGETVVTGLNQGYAAGPTGIDWTPDGRYMLVAQKDGVVRVVDNGILRSTPLIDISSEVNDVDDRGLLGIAVNPNFATNHYVYLLYTYDPPETTGQTGLAAPDQAGNRPSRLVRVTVDPTTMIADPASKVVLVGKNSNWAYTSRPDVNSTGDLSIVPSGIVNGTTITAPASQIEVGSQDNDPDRPGIQNQNIRDYLADDSDSHSIGAVHFGPDGYLYLSVGDGTSYNFADPRAVRVQDIHNLSGKLLRIDPITGEGVPGNPYYQASDPNSNASKVFYSGLRNPYRFGFDPVTNLPVVADVGWNSWEELDTGPAGSNFGWPYLEGPDRTASYQTLAQAITFYNNGNRNNTSDPPAVFPILTQSHGAPDNAHVITGVDFYNQNTMFFGDVQNGTIFAASLNASRQVTSVQLVDNVQGIVDMQKGPDGWLYGADLFDGTIRRWVDPSAATALGLAAAS
ncbi:DUF4082 domain-containing protein [Bradyrhizobium canariense]|uniref:DUF4082 domain-containing protein n=3 Tax=Bradyrhizobium canariense TaxID=255045 RepID=UPI000A18E190|nr:DUF4082 domain-containing protein [Bradyrhizobium canariense]OSI38618.1 hypothetical protein BST66_02150 [Bradyrhizobium canariense]OSI56956.1 hypothetical protein BST67_02520 [Bradyrhizobium canariense]